MNYDRVVHSAMESIAVSTIDDPMIELTIPANVFAEVLRIEIGPGEQAALPTPTPYAFYTATAAGTAGTTTTEVIQQGAGTIQGSVLRNLTAASATGFREFPQGAVPWEVGTQYLPVPQELFQLRGGGQDFFGVLFTTAPSAAVTFTMQIVWGEIG